MQNNKQYLQLMLESLVKKEKVLDEIMDANEVQMKLIDQEKPDWEAYDEQVDRKGNLIDELNLLDDGFESLYNGIKEELEHEDARGLYAQQIEELKKHIASLTEKSMQIQAKEARNKQRIESMIDMRRKEISSGRVSSKAAMDYYNNMRQTGALQSQFLDSKQ